MDEKGFEIVEAFVRFLSCGEFSEENTKGNTHTIIRMIRHLDEKAESYTEQDLRDAWTHGATRHPKEYKHINNFKDYKKLKHGAKKA